MGNVIKKMVVGLVVGGVLFGITKALEFPLVFQMHVLSPMRSSAPPFSSCSMRRSLKPLSGVKALGALVVFYVVLCVGISPAPRSGRSTIRRTKRARSTRYSSRSGRLRNRGRPMS